MLYNKQLNEIHTMNTIKPKIKWEDEIGEINWKLVNLIPFRCLIDTKLRTFQYKYIMRIIPNNKFLYKIAAGISLPRRFSANSASTSNQVRKYLKIPLDSLHLFHYTLVTFRPINCTMSLQHYFL